MSPEIEEGTGIAQAELETLLLEGLASGEAKIMTKESWSELRETVREHARRRKEGWKHR